jgi:hypothetical protein
VDGELSGLFGDLKVDLRRIRNAFRGVQDLERDKVAVHVVVEDDAGFLFVTFGDGGTVRTTRPARTVNRCSGDVTTASMTTALNPRRDA